MSWIIDFLRRLRLSHRHRRVELLGGYPGKEPSITVECFLPDLNRDERLRRVRARVAQLGAESFDEATGHPLDELIDKEGQDGEHSLDQQHEAYEARARQRLDQADAIASQYQQLLDEDLTRLRQAEIAMDTAVLALSGHEPEHFEDSVRAVKVIPGPSSVPGDHDPAAASMPQPDSAPAVTVRRPAGINLDSRAALAPPRVSRTELRRLLDPQDANRVPRWGEPGFRDGTLLAGRPRGAFLHVLALLLAAGADVGAFTQTVQLVLPQADWVVWLVVLGLTVTVLYIAHTIGAVLREARAAGGTAAGQPRRRGIGLGRGLAALVCTASWLAVGLLAFWVRYTVPLPVTPQVGGCGSVGIGSGAAGSCPASSAAGANGHPLQAAAIFLGLYLATGVVAGAGAYFTHNPYRSRYTAAMRAYRKASERAAASIYLFGVALAGYQRQQAEIDAGNQILAQAREQNDAFTGQLKQVARVEIAALVKDPAVTDAFFPPPP